MRTTVDIPDAIYRRVRTQATLERRSVKQFVLRGLELALKEADETPAPRLKEPIIRGKPGTLNITNEMINDLLDFA